MKNIINILSFFLLVFIFVSCNRGSNQIEVPNPSGNPSYPNVDVYKGDLLENSYVFAIKNRGIGSFLLDKQGVKVHEWTFDKNLGFDLEILPDGKLIGMFKVESPDFTFGGFGGLIRILKKNGSIDWEYEYSSPEHLSHHDFELLPNGNVLFIAWEKINATDARAAGVDTSVDIYPEVLIEVDPTTDAIVWEWHSFDHIIQDIFPTISNFGVLKDNPQLININYNHLDNGDIMHANGMDYDAVKDVVYLSVNFYSEIWVIDHSTTREEARTHTGGNHNKGGDLLYRFGNPSVYNNTEGTRLFFNNHFPNFLKSQEIGAGNLLVYVNRDHDSEQSAVYELKMPSSFDLSPNVNNEPEIIWSFTNTDMFYGKISGAVRLKNGNTLICEGDYGFWEITPSGEVAWKYNGQGELFWRCYSYTLDSPQVRSLGL